MSEVQKITRIPIKEAFKYENTNFTPWLRDNIDVVGEAIDIELADAESEQSTGSFSVDIKAESKNGDVVIIENQYGSSNHDHLGKLITYLSSFEARIAIWIVEIARQEHINAINWLNEGENDCDFYLMKIEAIRIGDSPAAPLLSVLAGPSDESKLIGKRRVEETENDKIRKQFWDTLLQRTVELGFDQFSAVSPRGKDGWVAVSSGTPGLSYSFWVNQKNCRIELRIDRGKNTEEENLDILMRLESSKEQIEERFGDKLIWADLEGHRVCSVRYVVNGGYKSEKSSWPSIIETVAKRMVDLHDATIEFVHELNI